MRVSRKSWHSRISNSGDYGKYGDNLCKYVQRIVFKGIAVCVLISIMGMALHAIITSGAAGLICMIILFSGLVLVLPVLAITKLRDKLGTSPEVPYESIVKAYIKAKKEKVCPMIEYVD